MAGIKVLLIEDDWIIAKEISYSLQDLGLDVVGAFDTGEEGLKKVQELSPDIVLLDIDLSSEMSGIEVGRKLKEVNGPPFIFLTALANSETIYRAKLVEPYAYLVKPVNGESLFATIEITMHNARKRTTEAPASLPLQGNLKIEDGLFVKANKRLEKILLQDILWVEAHDIYAMIKTQAGQYLLSNSLKTVEDRFPADKFIRVHRSYLVHINKIDAIEQNELVINGQHIPVGKTYRDELMKRLSIL